MAALFRLLAHLKEQPSGSTVDRGALAEVIGCSPRHAQRFLTYLKNSGFLSYDRQRRTYFLEERGLNFPLPLLDPEERLALSFAAALFTQQGFPFGRRVRDALLKAAGALPGGMRALLRDAAASVVVRPALAQAADAVVLELMQACQLRRTAEIDYTSRQRGREVRRIDPYGLDLEGAQWYVHAWCHANAAIRTFRLGAIHSLRLTPETFLRRDAEWEAFRRAPGVFLGLRGGAPVPVDVRFTPAVADYALRKAWPEGMHCTPEADGGARLTGIALGVEGVLVELLRWRRYASVLGGPELRRAMADEIAAMAKNYEISPGGSEQRT